MSIEGKKFHLIAIGGVGMSAIAKYLFQRGAVVSGSDIVESKYTHLLENMGIKVTIGHNESLISNDMTIIASSAVKDDNPEILKAIKLGLKIYHRSDILKIISDEFSQDENGLFIGFSGTHGKTTTSGLCSYILSKAMKHPSFIVGGIIPELNTNAEFDEKKYFIAELDESDGTIEKYSTDIAVINNIEEDHLDHYKNGYTDIAKTFNIYLQNKPEQTVIINNDNAGSKKFIELHSDYNYITFGIENADYTAKNIKFENFGSSFDIYKKNELITNIKMSIPGIHNVYNALAVACALIESGIDITEIKNHFTSFSGMGRRFQKVCEFNNITIYDDYAHHPSEIKTTLNGIKSAINKDNRLVAIFQPHRYTRLQSLWNEFKTSFNSADKLYITDVFPAGEAEISGINSSIFSQELSSVNNTYIKGNMKEIADSIFSELKEGDIVVTLGAGTITQLGKYLEAKFQEQKIKC